jgi:hypothetical protein
MLFAFLILAMATTLLLSGAKQQRKPGRWRARWPLARRWPLAGCWPLARCWSLAGRWLLAGRWSLAWRWSLGALVVAFGALNVSGSFAVASRTTVPSFISSGDYHRLLTPGEIVMVVSRTGDAGMLWQAESGFDWRLAGGYIGEGFGRRSGLPVGTHNLESPGPRRIDGFETLIRTDHIGAILVDTRHPPPWTRILGIFGLTGHQGGGVVVYPTDGCRTCHQVTWPEIHAAMFPPGHRDSPRQRHR